jgi:hypothetical protein
VSGVYGYAWGQAAQAELAGLQQALANTDHLMHQHLGRRKELAEQAAQALTELTEALLPSVQPDAIARAAEIVGYPNLVAADIPQRMATERAQLADHIARIEASPMFVQREFLFDPKVGKYATELAELNGARQSVREVLLRAWHPRLAQLLENGYGTPDYAVPFWRLSYYEDWEAGDAILESWPGKTFAEVRAEVLTAQEAFNSLTERISELENLISAGQKLLRDHADSREKLLSIVPRHLAHARQQLGRHVLDSGAATMGPRLSAHEDLDVLGKRVFGLAAKLTYFDRLVDAQLAPTRNEILASMEKSRADIAKYSRPKKQHMVLSDEAYQRRFRPRLPRYQKSWQRYQRTSDTVYVFDRYDRGSWAQDFLWWDLMTDGRLDGDFIPEVSYHRQAHPGYVYERHHGDDAHDVPPEPDPEPLHQAAGFDPS